MRQDDLGIVAAVLLLVMCVALGAGALELLQYQRERARRTQCVSGLKQISLPVHSLPHTNVIPVAVAE